ncbi:hypothetical protein LCGC14_2335110, partial [marine sediment metagenome]
HLDSVADGVTRGSLIYGNATPKWDELVIGAADTILASDGTDFSWTGSPSLSGILTVDTINEFTGAAGVTIEGIKALDSFLEFNEIAAPGAGAANKGRMYSVDRGGLTTLQWVDSGGVLAEVSHPPAVRVTRLAVTGNQPINNATNTALNFDEDIFDTDTMHDTVTNNSRLTATTAGKYQITGNVNWVSNGVGIRQVWFLLNGTTIIALIRDSGHGATTVGQVLTTLYSLAATDYVELFVHQTSTATIDILRNADYSPLFMMHWVAP